MSEMHWNDPRFVIAYTIIIGFAAAYIHAPDDTMKGALIAAFAGAWGFYLGSSSGSVKANERTDKLIEKLPDLPPMPPAAPLPVTVVNPREDPANVNEVKP